MRATFEQLDTMVKYGRFPSISYNGYVYICGVVEVEDLAHILFDCCLYKRVRDRYIVHILNE